MSVQRSIKVNSHKPADFLVILVFLYLATEACRGRKLAHCTTYTWLYYNFALDVPVACSASANSKPFAASLERLKVTMLCIGGENDPLTFLIWREHLASSQQLTNFVQKCHEGFYQAVSKINSVIIFGEKVASKACSCPVITQKWLTSRVTQMHSLYI
jgi:hypothetical protein